MKNKIIVAGSILVDRLQTIDAYPRAGELAQIRAISRAPGGLVPNVALDLRALAPEIPVLASGAVGRDENGDYVRNLLTDHGVDTSAIAVSETEATSFTDVMSVPGGERTFFTYPGASAQWGFDDFPFDRVQAGDIVLLGYFLLLAKIDAGDGVRILQELTRRGAKTAIDLVTENSNRYGLVRACLPYVDYLIINEVEAARIVGRDAPSAELAQDLMELGVRMRVVIHEPAKGTSLVRGGTCVEVSSFNLPPAFIKGKTGAGDAYCAGVLTGLCEGLVDEAILRRGALAAVGALSAPGATEGVRDFAALENLVDTVCNNK